VGSGSRGVGIALATEHAEVGVGWWMPVEDIVGSGKLKCFRGVAIEEVGGSVESFHPVGRGKVGLEMEGANDVVDGAQNTLSFAILLRGVGARHAENNTMG
jgi:hypothetical protein